jgi:hypothetical protein
VAEEAEVLMMTRTSEEDSRDPCHEWTEVMPGRIWTQAARCSVTSEVAADWAEAESGNEVRRMLRGGVDMG